MANKSVEDVAREVIAGAYGNGQDRVSNLTNAGYDFATVQNAVNSMLNGTYGGEYSDTYGSSPATSYQSEIDSINSRLRGYENIDEPEYVSKYGNQINDLASQIANRKFEYNAENDPVYKQYQKDYTRHGNQAMEDTLGKVSARTGGLASSYAYSAAAQTYDNYMQELASKIPELTALAREMYDSETNDLQRRLNNYNDLEQFEYQKYQDALTNARAKRNEEKSALEDSLKYYQNLLAAEQAAANQSYSGGGSSSGGSSSKKQTSSGNYDSVYKSMMYMMNQGKSSTKEVLTWLDSKVANGEITESEMKKLVDYIA